MSVLLVSDDLFNVDTPSSSVNGHDLTDFILNTTFGGATLNENRVSLSDWDGSAVILSSEFFAQMARHHLSTDAAGGREVSLSRLSSLTGNTCVGLHQ